MVWIPTRSRNLKKLTVRFAGVPPSPLAQHPGTIWDDPGCAATSSRTSRHAIGQSYTIEIRIRVRISPFVCNHVVHRNKSPNNNADCALDIATRGLYIVLVWFGRIWPANFPLQPDPPPPYHTSQLVHQAIRKQATIYDFPYDESTSIVSSVRQPPPGLHMHPSLAPTLPSHRCSEAERPDVRSTGHWHIPTARAEMSATSFTHFCTLAGAHRRRFDCIRTSGLLPFFE